MQRRLLNGDQLNRYRRESRLTYSQLNLQSGVPYSTMCRYLNGTHGYRDDLLDRLIEAINEARTKKTLQEIHLADVLDRLEINLSDCLADFLSWAALSGALKVSLRILAIDMTYGWENLLRTLQQATNSNICIDLLMLDSQVEGLESDSPASAVVMAWCHSADALHEMMCKRFQPYSIGNRVRLELRRYCMVPTFHGVCAKVDSDFRHYVTRCAERNWIVADYGWGEGEYLIISSNDNTARANKYRREFDNRFSALWESSPAGHILSC